MLYTFTISAESPQELKLRIMMEADKLKQETENVEEIANSIRLEKTSKTKIPCRTRKKFDDFEIRFLW